MASSSSSPWAQVRTPSQTLLAGMQLLRSWHRKPVLFVAVTQVCAPELAGGDLRGSRVVPQGHPKFPQLSPTLSRPEGLGPPGGYWAGWRRRGGPSPHSTVCQLCDLGPMTRLLWGSDSLFVQWDQSTHPMGLLRRLDTSSRLDDPRTQKVQSNSRLPPLLRAF